MKISDIKAYPTWVGHRNQLIVKVETDEGIHGWGESGLSGRELAVVGAVRHYREFLLGRDPREIGRLWQEMYRGQYFEGGRVLTAGDFGHRHRLTRRGRQGPRRASLSAFGRQATRVGALLCDDRSTGSRNLGQKLQAAVGQGVGRDSHGNGPAQTVRRRTAVRAARVHRDHRGLAD